MVIDERLAKESIVSVLNKYKNKTLTTITMKEFLADHIIDCLNIYIEFDKIDYDNMFDETKKIINMVICEYIDDSMRGDTKERLIYEITNELVEDIA